MDKKAMFITGLIITILLCISGVELDQTLATNSQEVSQGWAHQESQHQSAEQIRAVATVGIQSLAEVIEAVADKKIIYIGESHDQFAHHLVQLEIIKGLHIRQKKLAIGMEMFQRPFQQVLDTYIAGEISEREFLKKSEYFRRWGFDYHLYKPIIDFARSEKIPIVALNIQQEIVRRVAREGLEALSEADKQSIPPHMDFSDTAYRERLKETFRQHPGFEARNFEFFYQAQVLWDEAMAYSVAEFFQKHPMSQMVVLAGSGHLAYGSGIPKRTFRHTGYEYAIILNDAEMQREIAHYIVFPKAVESISAPKLMVFLDEEQEKVTIRGFPQDSVAQKAGLQVGDVIIALDGVQIKSIEDVRIDLLYRKKGEAVKVKALRKEAEIEFEVTL